MKRIFDDNATTATSNQVNLKECYDLVCKQKANLSFEELLFLLSELQEEILLRTTLIRETIPSDVWMNIYNVLSEKEDLSFIMSLKSVCKHWNNVFSECQLTVATIHNCPSLDWIPFIPNIQSFTIAPTSRPFFFGIEYFDKYLTNLVTLKICGPDIYFDNDENLNVSLEDLNLSWYDNGNEGEFFKHFINLRKLKFTNAKDFSTEFIDGIMPLKHLEKIDIHNIDSLTRLENCYFNFQLTKFLNNFNQVKDIKFPLLKMACYDFQKKYPHIRFRWYIENKIDKIYSGMYEGEFNEKNEFEGKGVLLFHNDFGKYEGEWKNGEKDGRGIEISYSTKGTIRYEGEWKRNERNGQGVCYFDDGTKYEGEWFYSSRNGIGIIYYPDGSVNYKGEFHRDFMTGKGIYYYKNGDRYEGDFLLNLKYGRGNYFHSDGGRYEGTWNDDVRECEEGEEMIYYFPNGSKYIGKFRNDDFHGNGIYYYSNGSRFEGEWKKGKRKKGIYYYADGSKYEGKWNKDKIGNYYFEDGSICEREWKYPKKKKD